MMIKRTMGVCLVCLVSLFFVSCGGAGGLGTNPGPGNTTGRAQGVYGGTTSFGSYFESIVLPNDRFYAIYGILEGNVFYVAGMVTGQGHSGSSSYTATVTDYYFTGAIYTGSINASYVPGASLNGTLVEAGVSETFTGTVLPAASFNYSAPAQLSSISGDWTGMLLDGTAATVTISASGSFTGSNAGCSFSGTVTPDASGKNFFNVSLTFGGAPCLTPGQTVTGVGVDYLLADGVTRQLVAAVSNASQGTVFIAAR